MRVLHSADAGGYLTGTDSRPPARGIPPLLCGGYNRL
jgi:hypothetical protein